MIIDKIMTITPSEGKALKRLSDGEILTAQVQFLERFDDVSNYIEVDAPVEILTTEIILDE